MPRGLKQSSGTSKHRHGSGPWAAGRWDLGTGAPALRWWEASQRSPTISFLIDPSEPGHHLLAAVYRCLPARVGSGEKAPPGPRPRLESFDGGRPLLR